MRQLLLLLLIFIIYIFCNTEFLNAQTINKTVKDTTIKKNDTKSDTNSIFSKLLKAISVSDDKNNKRDSVLKSDSKIIQRQAGKIIRKINVKILDLFGASVYDPEDTVRSWIERTGNSLHFKTKEWVIKNKLIISEGQKFIPDDIKEDERILRQSPFIYDVRIIPEEIFNNSDSIDIMLYIQDIWSTNGAFSYHPGSKVGSISLSDINLIGLGSAFTGGLKFNPDFEHGWDWNGSYTFANIERTYLSANISYLSEIDHQQYGLMIGRDFFSPVIKWAGAVAQNWQNFTYPQFINKSGSAETAKFNQQDYWLGYAFDFRPYDSTHLYQNRFNVAGRITRTVFSKRPEFDTVNAFEDNTFYLGRIGYSYTTYYQDQYIFGLGKTEDIPLIKMIEFIFGLDKGTNTSRPYYGIKTGYSLINNNLGYFYGGFQVGAFYNDKKWLNRSTIWDMFYFSNLKRSGNYTWRYYLGSRYSSYFDPLIPIDILNINNEAGIRGFTDNELIGNKKLVLNYEADIFLPLKPLGFNIALITFADFGLISPTNLLLFDSKLYQGYGFGFRIQNEHLIFPSFQIMFGIYPNRYQSGGAFFDIFNQSALYYQFNQFQFSIPSVVLTQ
jgi:hypothetical protein